jgi:hypothetical protein
MINNLKLFFSGFFGSENCFWNIWRSSEDRNCPRKLEKDEIKKAFFKL